MHSNKVADNGIKITGNKGALHLSATKSRLGHAEPAAGAAGIVSSVMMLGDSKHNAIMSLHHVRPVVLHL